MKDESFDAILLVSFGGPECTQDVMPFLRNVTRGRNVPEERLGEVAHHYEMFGGKSPINDQNRALLQALQRAMSKRGLGLPLYWGNRNWHPLLPDTVKSMARDGIRRALALVTSAYSSYSGCRQYLEDIEKARAATGEQAPEILKLRAFFNHPGFVKANAARLREALSNWEPAARPSVRIAFTAHSIPAAMASGCSYEKQLLATAELIAAEVGARSWNLAYQSRSGPPSQSWLGPDILDFIREMKRQGETSLAIAPIGFISDHMEVVYDLDFEAGNLCAELGMTMHRAPTAGTHDLFVDMICDLIEERIEGRPPACTGDLEPAPHLCSPDCCPSGAGAHR